MTYSHTVIHLQRPCVQQIGVGLRPHGVHVCLLVRGQADVLHVVRQLLAHDLLELGGVPAVDVPVERDHGHLAPPVVVGEGAHAVGGLAPLLEQRAGVQVGGDLGLKRKKLLLSLWHMFARAQERRKVQCVFSNISDQVFGLSVKVASTCFENFI